MKENKKCLIKMIIYSILVVSFIVLLIISLINLKTNIDLKSSDYNQKVLIYDHYEKKGFKYQISTLSGESYLVSNISKEELDKIDKGNVLFVIASDNMLFEINTGGKTILSFANYRSHKIILFSVLTAFSGSMTLIGLALIGFETYDIIKRKKQNNL